MFNQYTDCCVLDVDPYFVSERSPYPFEEFHRVPLEMNEIITSSNLINVSWSSVKMAGHSVMG